MWGGGWLGLVGRRGDEERREANHPQLRPGKVHLWFSISARMPLSLTASSRFGPNLRGCGTNLGLE